MAWDIRYDPSLLVLAGALTINTSSLTSVNQGAAYDQSLSVSGGTEPYLHQIISGALPDEMLLTWDGRVTGSPPQTAGTYNFTVQVTDAVGATATKALSLTVNSTAFAFSLTTQYQESIDPTNDEVWLGNNAWGNGISYGQRTDGWSARSVQVSISSARPTSETGQDGYPPNITQGTHNGYAAGHNSTMPWMGGTTLPQISALEELVVFVEQDQPRSRASVRSPDLHDDYVYNISNPDSSGTGDNKAVCSIMIHHNVFDNQNYWQSHMLNGTDTVLGGRRCRVYSSSESWAQTPTGGSWTNNTVRIYFYPIDDGAVSAGQRAILIDMKALIEDLIDQKSTFGINITSSMYFGSVQYGWESIWMPTTPKRRVIDWQLHHKTASWAGTPEIKSRPLAVEAGDIQNRTWGTSRVQKYATSGGYVTGSYATAQLVTAQNNLVFRSNTGAPSGSPVYVAYDCTNWSNKDSLLFNMAPQNANAGQLLGTTYSVPGDYKVQVNAASFSGSTPPASGWSDILDVTSNVRSARLHHLDATGANSIRFYCTAGASTNAETDCAGHFDFHAAPMTVGAPFAFAIMSDSIGALTFPYGNAQGASGNAGIAAYLGDMIGQMCGITPAIFNMSTSGWHTNSFLPYVNGTSGNWLSFADQPARVLHFALGTNDIANGIGETTFKNNTRYFFDTHLGTRDNGLIVAQTVPIRTDDISGGNIHGAYTYSQYIKDVAAEYSSDQVKVFDFNPISYDLRSIFFDGGDSIHPSVSGRQPWRRVIGDWWTWNIILGRTSSSWVCPIQL